jgi:hypothetical protein
MLQLFLVAVRGFDTSRNPVLAIGLDFDGTVRLAA